MARRRLLREARTTGAIAVRAPCSRHGESEFQLRNDGAGYRCMRCRSEDVATHRRGLKAVLVAEAGGCCARCGYDRCIAALHFHHVDRSTKLFAVSGRGLTRSLEFARAEAEKCILLCANCHAEVESGLEQSVA